MYMLHDPAKDEYAWRNETKRSERTQGEGEKCRGVFHTLEMENPCRADERMKTLTCFLSQRLPSQRQIYSLIMIASFDDVFASVSEALCVVSVLLPHHTGWSQGASSVLLAVWFSYLLTRDWINILRLHLTDATVHTGCYLRGIISVVSW